MPSRPSRYQHADGLRKSQGCRRLSAVLRQPGTARARTIMVPVGPPQLDIPPPAVPFGVRHNPWLDTAWRWRDVEISRLEALISDVSIRTEKKPAVEKDLEQLLERLRAADRHEPMRRLFEALLGSDELVDALAEVEGAS